MSPQEELFNSSHNIKRFTNGVIPKNSASCFNDNKLMLLNFFFFN